MWKATGETYRTATDFLIAINAAFAGKQRVENTCKPSSSLRLLGPLGPGFSEIELEKHTNYPETAKNSRRKGGFTCILHSPLCRRPVKGTGLMKWTVGENLAVKRGQRQFDAALSPDSPREDQARGSSKNAALSPGGILSYGLGPGGWNLTALTENTPP